MSIYGMTKDTKLAPMMKMMAQGEAKGVMMYYALARIASEQGMNQEIVNTFIEAGNQEAKHAGFYAAINGDYPQDFWTLVYGLAKAEAKGEGSVQALADKVRGAGFEAAADDMEAFAQEEGHHGVILGRILSKYGPKIDVEGKVRYICAVCGYEHIGDINDEPDDYVCPICGQPKTVFKKA